ncbi:hypothetical protein Gotri_002222, partial [Gossypium trilobum]|nr:hypothetical protein [Gossypium klotzschianum]MBA0750408.1 hypothetical protein [Gossypium gossypioides]MBA0781284.1 hypothetical protein [Gossypium trilobum]
EELTRALIEVKDDNIVDGGTEGSLETFSELVKEMTSKQQDIKAFAFKTKAMRMEEKEKNVQKIEGLSFLETKWGSENGKLRQ